MSTEPVSRDWLIGVAGAGAAVAGMLAYSLYGKPAYAFYTPMKLAVAVVAGIGCWALMTISKRYLPLALCLGFVGVVFLVGKMHKREWLPYDWAALVLMLILSGIMTTHALLRRRPTT